MRLCRRRSLNWGLPRYLEDCATTDSTPACNSNPLQDIDQTTAAYARVVHCCSKKSHSQHSKRKLPYHYSPQRLTAVNIPPRRSSTAHTPEFCRTVGASSASDTTHTTVGHEEHVLTVANYGSRRRMHAACSGANRSSEQGNVVMRAAFCLARGRKAAWNESTHTGIQAHLDFLGPILHISILSKPSRSEIPWASKVPRALRRGHFSLLKSEILKHFV